MKRRSFLAHAAAMSAVPAGLLGGPFGGEAIASVGSDRQAPRFLVIDERFGRARALASRSVADSGRVLRTRGDVTAIWYASLEPSWRETPGAVEGMTTPDALFCLQELARDHGLRVAARSVIEPASPSLVHWLLLPGRVAA